MAFSKILRARYSDLKVFTIAEDKLGQLTDTQKTELEVQGSDGEWYRPFRFFSTDEQTFDTSDD